MTGYRFTADVRHSLMLARAEAARLRHGYVGTEHILLGLVAQEQSNAMLRELSADPADIRRSVERCVEKGTGTGLNPMGIPYTARAKKTLELAMTEARALRHNFVGNEHLMLALMREESGIGSQVLREHAVSADAIRARLLREHPSQENVAHERRRPLLMRLTGKHVLVMTVLWTAMWVALQPDILTWRVLVLVLVIFVPPIMLLYVRGRRWRRWRG